MLILLTDNGKLAELESALEGSKSVEAAVRNESGSSTFTCYYGMSFELFRLTLLPL